MAKESASKGSFLEKFAASPVAQGSLAAAAAAVSGYAIHQVYIAAEARPAPSNQLSLVTLDTPRPRWEGHQGKNYFILTPPGWVRYGDTYTLEQADIPRGALSVGILTLEEQISIDDYAKRFIEQTQPKLQDILQAREDIYNTRRALTVTYPVLNSSKGEDIVTLVWKQNPNGTITEIMVITNSDLPANYGEVAQRVARSVALKKS